MIIGWGKYTHSDHLSDVLLQTKVPIHSLKRCESVYNDFVRLNRNQHLCAGNLNGSSGACVGDSGGGKKKFLLSLFVSKQSQIHEFFTKTFIRNAQKLITCILNF